MISFGSLEFMFRFLPVFLIVYYAFPAKHRNTILLIGSIVFYAMGEPVFILLNQLRYAPQNSGYALSYAAASVNK